MEASLLHLRKTEMHKLNNSILNNVKNHYFLTLECCDDKWNIFSIAYINCNANLFVFIKIDIFQPKTISVFDYPFQLGNVFRQISDKCQIMEILNLFHLADTQ